MGHSEPARPPDEKPLAGRAFPLTSCKGHDDMAGGGLDTSFVGSDGTLQEACFVPKSRQAGQGAWASSRVSARTSEHGACQRQHRTLGRGACVRCGNIDRREG